LIRPVHPTAGSTKVVDMWFEDLSPCTGFFPPDAQVLAVGWLERGRPYASGEVDRRVYEALAEIRKDPWQPFVTCGFHECDLCRFEGEARGKANLFIPADGVIYMCPELVVHYINGHGYAPPEPFRRAVLACPPMRSMAYLRALASCGGARLFRSSGDGE
jgi:hypothetical protein